MRVALLTLLITLVPLVPEALGDLRYTTQLGADAAPCTSAQPCSLPTAMTEAEAGDEVIVGGGTYNLGAPAVAPFSAVGLYAHGDHSGPPPEILADFAETAFGSSAPNSRIGYASIRNSDGPAAICGPGGTAERLRVTGGVIGAYVLEGCIVRDSLIRTTAPGSAGLYAICEDEPSFARNVTVVAPGEKSFGILAYNDTFTMVIPKEHCSLDLRNAIVEGAGADLATQYGFNGDVEIVVSNSSFDTTDATGGAIVQGSGNQTTPPLFVNPATGDYHEAPGSPTIDAGAADPLNGPIDPDGVPRTLGAAPDIGAFEFTPAPSPVPSVPTGRITSLKLRPSAFRARKGGGAFISAKKKRRKPVGTRVAYSLSAPATVGFTVERKLRGRRKGRRCVKQTRANRKKKRCVRFRRVRGGFSHPGGGGVNRFRFSGRVRGKGLRPGRYRLVGRAGGARRTAAFRIVR